MRGAPGRLLVSRLKDLLGVWDEEGFWQHCQDAGWQWAGMFSAAAAPTCSALTAVPLCSWEQMSPIQLPGAPPETNPSHRPSHCRHIKVRNIIHDNQSPLHPGFLSSLCGGIMTFPPASGKIIQMKWKIFSYLS